MVRTYQRRHRMHSAALGTWLLIAESGDQSYESQKKSNRGELYLLAC